MMYMMNLSREVTNVLSTGIDIYNCAICLFMIFSLAAKVRTHKTIKYLVLSCISVLIYNIADIANWIAEGNSPAWHVPYLHIMMFIFYLMVPVTMLFLIKYIQAYFYPKKISPWCFYICLIFAITYICFLIATPFTGLFYYFTPDNYYMRGKYNWISVLFFIIFYLLSVIIIFINRKLFNKRQLMVFLSFPFLPLLMHVIQLKFYGLGLVNTGMTFSILFIFMNAHQDLEIYYKRSTDEVQDKEQKLIKFQEHTINSLSNLVENRDTETGEHAKRTSIFIEIIAHQTLKDGHYTEILTEDYIKNMVKAAPMHDIGKIVVSDTLLKKPGKLSFEEYELMKEHASEGGRIVKDIIGISDDRDYVKTAIEMAQWHHEHWDGTGYPDRLKKTEIPLCARFMAIADVFDALVFERCYKKPIPPDQAFEIMLAESATHFDPILIEEFLKVKDQILRIISE